MLFLNLDRINSFKDATDLLEKSTSYVSFWGGKKICFKNVFFPVSLDSFSNHIIKILNHNNEYGQPERFFLTKVENKILEYNSNCESYYKYTYNFVAKICYFVRNILFHNCNKDDIECQQDKHCNLYTYGQFKEKYEYAPSIKCPYLSPPRWRDPILNPV